MILKIVVMLTFPIYSFSSNFEQTAKKFLKPIKKAFMKELKSGMTKGPYNAIDTCHLKAPHLIEHDKADKYSYGRTSLRYRSKQNKPKDWMVSILNEYNNSSAKNPMPSKVILVHGKQAFIEPIYIKPVCLNCHGNVKGSVSKRLKKLYPNDKAIGYKLGQFRGLFWFREK